MKLPTRDQLVKRRATTLADMQSKMEAEDWHGVQDCGSGLREIDAMLAVLDATSEVFGLGRSPFDQADLAQRNREALERSSA